MSLTGASADEWVPIRPGTDGVLALGIAHLIMAADLYPAAAAGRAGDLIDGWGSGLANYAPEEVERITGVATDRVERLARQFGGTRPAVAMVGGPPLAHSNGLFTALAVNALNALVGATEQPGGVFFTPQLDVAAATQVAGLVPPAAATIEQLDAFHHAAGVAGTRAVRAGPLHRELWQLPRRNQYPGGSDPAGSLVTRIVD
jgi:anaerobic selenocysteine-containing dehydrogenase